MTVALAALSAVLAVALTILAAWTARDRRRLLDRLAREEAALVTAQSALAEARGDTQRTRSELDERERCLRDSTGAADAAERLRVEREWRELAGPQAPLPAPWDGTLGCLVANELEIIREVVGTPSTVDVVAGRPSRSDGRHRLRLTAEFLREAARASDELKVRVTDAVVVFGVSSAVPSLDGSRAAADRAGAHLVVDPAEEGFVATLRFSEG